MATRMVEFGRYETVRWGGVEVSKGTHPVSINPAAVASISIENVPVDERERTRNLTLITLVTRRQYYVSASFDEAVEMLAGHGQGKEG